MLKQLDWNDCSGISRMLKRVLPLGLSLALALGWLG